MTINLYLETSEKYIMSTIPSQKNAVTLLKNFRQDLTARTNINNFDRDSKTRAMIDSFTNESLDLRNQWVDAFYAQQAGSAQGADLEEIGRSRGVDKIGVSFAFTTLAEGNLAFYVESGTFGDINGGSPIALPAGTIIRSTPNNNEFGSVVEYKTEADYTLAAASGIAFIGAKAVASGTDSNVGSNVLTEHSFDGYTDAGSMTLKVMNLYPILNAGNVETDSQYRFRIARRYPSLLQSNNAKIQLASLAVPGVQDLKVIPGYFGIGTVGVIVLGPENQSSQLLISSVQNRLRQSHVPGLSAIATPAIQVNIDLVLNIELSKSLTDVKKLKVRADIRRIIMDQLRATGLNGTVSFSALLRAILLQQSDLLGVISADAKNHIFEKIYIRRGLANASSSERELLLTNSLSLDQDEFATLGTLEINYRN